MIHQRSCIKIRNLAFYEWEDAILWSQWIHYFHRRLCYLGTILFPCSCCFLYSFPQLLSSHHGGWCIAVWGVPTPSSVQFSSVAQSCLTLWDPMDCSMPGFPVHQQLLEFTLTHVHQVGNAIQPSHPLSSPSPPAFNLSQHQGLFQMSQFFTSSGQSIGVSASASVLPMNIQN